MSKGKEIGRLLLEYGLISNDDLKEGLKLQKETDLRLGEALARLGKVNMDDIEWVLSKQLDIPFVIVDDINLNNELLEKLQHEFLIKNRVLPLYETEDHISIVIEDPSNKAAIDFISDYFGKKVETCIGSGRKIEKILKNVLKKAGIPELVNAIKEITGQIQETSFYRIDFLLSEHTCKVNVFGSGILRNVASIEGDLRKDEIFRAFSDLDLSILYEESINKKETFLSVYPLTNKIDKTRLPAISGCYGLLLPDETAFSNIAAYGAPHIFQSDNPVQGYPYISTQGNTDGFEKAIHTIDTAPPDFKDFYVKISIPEKCELCNGAGCQACKHLGYEFEAIEGVYCADDLKDKLREG